ncbi:MAG: (d)CMP kinase [Thermodesulfobacteria bacterium]|nr:(d)CMP kinase [Thermodesulfobacteriota bacterium]
MRPKGLLVTIDGPAGAGKSTIARLLAQKLGYLYLDTGAMYRAVALAAKRRGISPEDEEALTRLCRELDLKLVPRGDGLAVMLDGEDVSEEIRTPEIDRLSSMVAKVPGVRECLKERQRALGEAGGVVAEGRDMGSHVFPDADLKFFLTASPEVRAKRREQDLRRKGYSVSYEKVLQEILERDRRDQEREVAPLVVPEGAILIDTSSLTTEEVLKRLLEEVERRLSSVS